MMNSAGDPKPMKTVGRRTALPDVLKVENSRIEDSIKWRKHFGGVGIPKGVFRFHSHEEADAWLWKMITRPRKT